MREYVLLMSRYNAWANRTLYEAVATLPETEITRDRRAFFGSILGTLNHGLVGDRLWLSRLTGESLAWFQGLDQVLHPDFAALRAAREALDARILAVMPTVAVEGTFVYRDSRGMMKEAPYRVIVPHIFNHQTHHRGQVHDMLSQAGLVPPPLDLLYFPREG
ncbi:DinB family protein [Pararhodospirillum oryzae]|uniref:Damage-inducible protein DinB n=1 Tax=Pararhodospirillum oryzae TaxID=478448 RepID=A0A512HC63_9PROT|nr:DinB family protein [Pararhodospirillum oryzae]GEO83046.1 damage-inducible protein DinB [Pararhodospirillum oryzae]